MLCAPKTSRTLCFFWCHIRIGKMRASGEVCVWVGGGPHPLMRQQVAHVVITHCRRAVPLGSLEMATGHAQLNKLTSWSNHCPHRRKNVHQTQPHISIISYTHYPIKWVFFYIKIISTCFPSEKCNQCLALFPASFNKYLIFFLTRMKGETNVKEQKI